MPYRRTENVVRRLAEREQTIVDAARSAALSGGLSAVQIASVAQRAGIASGTVYRYFPSKFDLVSEVLVGVTERTLDAMRAAAGAAPGPLSALAAAIAAFATHALAERRLVWAALAEPIGDELNNVRLDFRRALIGELQSRMRAAMAHGHMPDQNLAVAAPAVIGALLEALLGPLAPDVSSDRLKTRETVQTATIFALRALGVVDARARGVVAQLVW